MGIEIITGAGDEGLPISEAVRAGDFIFVSGMVGFEPNSTNIDRNGIGAETKQIFRQLKEILDNADAGFDQVAKVNVYLTDSKHFDGFNAVYKTYFANKPPARICVVAQLTIDALVELDCTVYVGD